MARHQLLPSRPAHRASSRVARHAVIDREHAGGPTTARRGIAVVAVVGGAAAVGLSTGALAAVRDPDAGTAVIGLAATDAGTAPAPRVEGDLAPAVPAVLDTGAMARAVRDAHAEGRKLVERRVPAAPTDAAPTATPPAATPPAATPPAATPADPGRRALRSPGDLLDTDDWKLTVPTGSPGSPDEIDGARLAGYHSEYFALNAARSGIVFSASGGGVTTKNSKYPRSELREMDGSRLASWSNTTGTHVLDVREAFTKLPAAKPHVVGVQIHDGDDDVLQVRLEGRTLSVQSNDGRSATVLDPDYRLGTAFDLRLVAANGEVEVFYDGAKKETLPLSGSGWYWKVGAYVQSTAKGPDSTGEVVVYRANVTHR